MSHATLHKQEEETRGFLGHDELGKRRALLKKAKEGDELTLWTLRRIYHLTKWWNKEDGTIVGE